MCSRRYNSVNGFYIWACLAGLIWSLCCYWHNLFEYDLVALQHLSEAHHKINQQNFVTVDVFFQFSLFFIQIFILISHRQKNGNKIMPLKRSRWKGHFVYMAYIIWNSINIYNNSPRWLWYIRQKEFVDHPFNEKRRISITHKSIIVLLENKYTL